jgi:hypothetical protein
LLVIKFLANEVILFVTCEISLIPKATDVGSNRLIVRVPAHIATAGVQVAEQCEVIVDLRSTPKDSAGANIGEITNIKSKTTWESGKTTFIRSPSIWSIPIGSANGFHLTPCHAFSPKII